MAKLIGSIHKKTGFETVGHATICKMFQELLKPHGQSFVWYQPKISDGNGRGPQPDFLLYTPWLGLLILEVRDWALLALKSFTDQEIRLENNGIIGIAANPLDLARRAAEALQERISIWPELRVHTGLVFTAIIRDNFAFHGMHASFGGAIHVIFAEDIQAKGRLTKDRSGSTLKRIFCHMFQPQPLPLKLTAEALAETLKIS